MSDRITDIRKILDLVAEASENEFRTGPQTLNEGLFDGLKAYMHKRQGAAERGEVAAELMKGYNIWLGKMDRQGTMADIEDFLKGELSFNSADLDAVLGPASQQGEEPAQAQTQEPEAAEEPEEEPEQEAEPEAQEEPAAEPEHDDEEGREIPADLDTKLSDYGDVGKNEFHADASTYKQPDGSWNEDLIIKKLEQLAKEHDGAPVLILGDDKFSLNDNDTSTPTDDELEKVAAESIMEDGVRVGRRQLKDIFNKAAVAYISKNGGRSASSGQGDSGQAPSSSAPANSGGSKGGKGNGDNYDLDKMWQILQQHGVAKGTVTKVMNKVRASSSTASLSDNDMQDLALIGFAFLKSGL